MKGRIKRKLASTQALASSYSLLHSTREPVVCPLCDRPIPPSQRDAHHLIPKSRGGDLTVWLHRICHRQVHALFTEVELEREYPHTEALRSHPDMARFISWVQRKPDDFFERTRRSHRLKIS